MKTKNVHTYDKLSHELKKKVATKYLNDPLGSIIRMPDDNSAAILDMIEVLHNGEYHLVIVTENDLRKMHWDAFPESGDEGMSLPYLDNENYDDLFDDGSGY